MKHGVGFDEAIKVFSDPFLIVREHRVIEHGSRLHAIGYAGRVLVAVHTIEEEGVTDAIRIISARQATPSERKFYEECE